MSFKICAIKPNKVTILRILSSKCISTTVISTFYDDIEHKAILGHCKLILESEGRRIAINPDRFDKLITALRKAVDNDGTLDKEATSYNDMLDAFRLALKFYHFRDSSDYG
jgi:hypothetical protein